jgi:hypothetical protein
LSGIATSTLFLLLLLLLLLYLLLLLPDQEISRIIIQVSTDICDV